MTCTYTYIRRSLEYVSTANTCMQYWNEKKKVFFLRWRTLRADDFSFWTVARYRIQKRIEESFVFFLNIVSYMYTYIYIWINNHECVLTFYVNFVQIDFNFFVQFHLSIGAYFFFLSFTVFSLFDLFIYLGDL